MSSTNFRHQCIYMTYVYFSRTIHQESKLPDFNTCVASIYFGHLALLLPRHSAHLQLQALCSKKGRSPKPNFSSGCGMVEEVTTKMKF
jgi:hypothetical protein